MHEKRRLRKFIIHMLLRCNGGQRMSAFFLSLNNGVLPKTPFIVFSDVIMVPIAKSLDIIPKQMAEDMNNI